MDGTPKGIRVISTVFSIFYYLFLLLPDIALTIALFPLSFYVISSTETISDSFVNLVAVQVFAQLDDVLVRLLVLPRKSLGDIIDNYCDGFISEYRRNENLNSDTQDDLLVTSTV